MKKIGIVTFLAFIISFSFVAIGGGAKLNLRDLEALIGKDGAYLLGMYEDTPSNNEYLINLINDEKKHRKTSREVSQEYVEIRRRYIIDGIKLKLEESKASRSIASVEESSKEKLIYKVPQYLGLTFFKRNDLNRMCAQVVKKAKSLGAEGIAFFYPVHFSGGNSEKFFMPANPIYGRDYRYENAQAPGKTALFECLDNILKNKLKVNYIPHLESISSLASSGKKEWRMYSGIPLDEYYYYYSFGHLIRYMKSSKKRKQLAKKLLVTIGAEIDNMVLGHPKDTLGTIKQLKSDLASLTKTKVPIMLNTNGDFYHMWKIPQAQKDKLNCSDLESLIGKIDYLSPSMYGDKGHFKTKASRLSLSETLEQYYTQFENSLPRKCKYVAKSFRKVDIGFGEFALDPSLKQNYADILKNPGPVKFVQYWNHSKWDHLAIYPENRLLNQKARKQLISN